MRMCPRPHVHMWSSRRPSLRLSLRQELVYGMLKNVKLITYNVPIANMSKRIGVLLVVTSC